MARVFYAAPIQRKGDKAKGEADVAAANAIAPGLAQLYQRFGLAAEGAPAAAKS